MKKLYFRCNLTNILTGRPFLPISKRYHVQLLEQFGKVHFHRHSTSHRLEIHSTLNFYYNVRVFNVIVIVPNSKSFRVFSFQPFVEENDGVYEIGNNLTRTEEIFHDKLENLHKYSYKLLVYAEPVKYVKRTIKLFATICEKQNATKHSTLVLIVEEKNFLALYKNAMIWRKVDLTLNSAVEVNLDGVPLQSVNTYDQKAFCSMIPLPSRTSFFELVLQSFDIFI